MKRYKTLALNMSIK